MELLQDFFTDPQNGAIAALIAYVFTQLSAILGKPNWIKHVRLMSQIWDVLAGNYGKSKNKEE